MSTNEMQSESATNEGFANHPHLAAQTDAARDNNLFVSFKTRATQLMTTFEANARANPWLHIAVAGAGALTVGYFVGRSLLKEKSSAQPTEIENVPAGYDE